MIFLSPSPNCPKSVTSNVLVSQCQLLSFRGVSSSQNHAELARWELHFIPNNKFIHNNLSRSRTRRPVADTEGKVWATGSRHVWSSGHNPSQCNSCSQKQSHASWRPPVTMTGRLRASRHSVIRFDNLTGYRMSAGILFDRTHDVIPERLIMF